MDDWALEYIRWVLDKKAWSASHLAKRAGISPTTLTRPLSDPNWPHAISRTTLNKIAAASGLEEADFKYHLLEKEGMTQRQIKVLSGELHDGTPLSKAEIERAQRNIDLEAANEITIQVYDGYAKISAEVDREGLKELIRKLEALSVILQ